MCNSECTSIGFDLTDVAHIEFMFNRGKFPSSILKIPAIHDAQKQLSFTFYILLEM